MNLKFTASNFELDLYKKNLNIVEENHWFSDQFFTKYSFPVEFDLTKELDAALKMITHNNAARSAKTFEGYFEMFGKETEALLVIERIQGLKAQGKFRYGFEEFPNFDKKLTELDLERVQLAQPLATFALPFLDKTYPEVNYNFPALIVDHFDTSSVQWQYFEGMLNNYQNGAFLQNEFLNDEQVNRNVMQPAPYLLYVIAQAFAEKGLELRGEILTDPDFKDALITIISDFYSTSSQAAIEMTLKASQYTSIETVTQYFYKGYCQVGQYDAAVQLTGAGVYKIAGNIIVRTDATAGSASLKVFDNVIWSTSVKNNLAYHEYFYSIDRNVEVPLGTLTTPISFMSSQLAYGMIDQNQDPEAMILDLTITKIAGYDQNGKLVPTLVSASEINLQKCVPDITFGELLKVVKNWKNYDVKIGDGYVEMNKIQHQMNAARLIDLSAYEVKEPIRDFYQDATFLLQFQEINSEEYQFAKVFVDANGSRSSSYIKRDDTHEITINGLPLPHKQLGTSNTAHLFTDSKSAVLLAIYPGLLNGTNATRSAAKLLLPEVFELDWKDWLDFRINAEGFEWSFHTGPELAGKITQDAQLAAYGRKFIVRRVSKKNQSRNSWEITVECDGTN